MGIIISKFRKEPPSLEQQLETVEKNIFQIHEFNEATEHAMKKIIGAMLFYGTVLIIIAGVISYFVFDHSSVASSLVCFAPVILAPIILLGSKRILQYYYTSRIERNKEELNKLIKEKKGLINKVKETETYKKAQEILEKYDPDTRMRKAQSEQQRMMNAVLQHSGMDIRRRMVGTPMGVVMQRGAQGQQQQQQQQLALPQQQKPQFTPLKHGQTKKTPLQPMPLQNMMPSVRSPYIPRMARPILPQDRGAVEKMIDYIVGEGPNNRYALICKKCSSHNGMALREEFEFLAFQCCYCFHFNPARKQRPLAPPPPSLSAANSTTSLNEISRSGSPAPSGPSVKDSDQEFEATGDAACPDPAITDDVHIGPAEGDAPTGARPAPEGNENESELLDDDQHEHQMQQEHETVSNDHPE